MPIIDFNKLHIEGLPNLLLTDLRKLPRLSCVYFVSDRKGTLLYIGTTFDLKQRWSGKHKCKEILGKTDGVKISWLALKGNKFRQSAEAYLIQIHSPELNSSIAARKDWELDYWHKYLGRLQRKSKCLFT